MEYLHPIGGSVKSLRIDAKVIIAMLGSNKKANSGTLMEIYVIGQNDKKNQKSCFGHQNFQDLKYLLQKIHLLV